jgi:hypothetical protein
MRGMWMEVNEGGSRQSKGWKLRVGWQRCGRQTTSWQLRGEALDRVCPMKGHVSSSGEGGAGMECVLFMSNVLQHCVLQLRLELGNVMK